MADWLIHARDNKQWRVHLADCDEEHANSVLDNVLVDPACPNDLFLECTKPDPEPEPESELGLLIRESEPEPDPEPEPRKRFRFRRSK